MGEAVTQQRHLGGPSPALPHLISPLVGTECPPQNLPFAYFPLAPAGPPGKLGSPFPERGGAPLHLSNVRFLFHQSRCGLPGPQLTAGQCGLGRVAWEPPRAQALPQARGLLVRLRGGVFFLTPWGKPAPWLPFSFPLSHVWSVPSCA